MNAASAPLSAGSSRERAGLATTLAVMVLAVLLVALFARVMTAPLRHDEQLFFTAGMMFGHADLYRDLGYNHLPNLPILLSAVDALFPARPFLGGRLLVFAGWLAAAGVLAALAMRATGDRWVAALSVLLLITNPLLIDRPGTMITNNFLPVPFALAGVMAFIVAADRDRPRPGLVFVAGLLIAIAIGFKANFVLMIPPFAVAALMVPRDLGLADRLRLVTVPLLAGGIVGGLPTLWYFGTDPQGFMAHVLGYHQGPHRAWAAAQDDDLVISLRDRLMLAQSLWMAGTTLLTGVLITTAGVHLWRRGWRPRWPVLLVAGLTLCGAIVAFVPTPSFPQYFVPPLPFALVLTILLLGDMTRAERRVAAPLLIAVAALAIVGSGPRLLAELPGLMRPARWTGNDVHRVSEAIVAAADGRPVATLSPVHVMEAGGVIYPELAAGPFVYRVADLIPAADRRHYRMASTAGLPTLLDADPPGAILVGLEGKLDDAFRAYAAAREYRRVPLPPGRDPSLELYVRR